MAGRKIQFKRGLESNLPTLDVAEMGMTTNTKKLFYGSDTGNIEIAKKVDLDTVGTNLAVEVASRLSDKADNTTQLALKAGLAYTSSIQSQVNSLVATSSVPFYQKCLSTDTGALLVVASGATTGEINLASVTPLATGYTAISGDYVRLVYGVASGTAELITARSSWTVLDDRIKNQKPPSSVYDASLADIPQIDASVNTATTYCGLDRLFVLTAFTTGSGIKSAEFTTLQVGGIWNDFTLYLLRKTSGTTYEIVYSQVVPVTNGTVNFSDIRTNEELYIGWKANVQYDGTVVGVYADAYGTVASIVNNILTVTTTDVFNPICTIVLYGGSQIPLLQGNISTLNNTRLIQSEVLLNWTTASASSADGVRMMILDNPISVGLKAATFYTAQVGGLWKDFKFYILEKISETQFNVLYYKKYTVTNGTVVIDDIVAINLAILGKTAYIGLISNTIYTSTSSGQPFYVMTLVGTTATGAISGSNANFNGVVETYTSSVSANAHQGKYLSILGDSIETYQGYIPVANAYYFPNAYITDVSQTWWKKLLNTTGMILSMNNSWSGSRVCGVDVSAGNVRSTNLDDGTNIPNYIIFYMGVNDFKYPATLGVYDGNGSIPTDSSNFREAYTISLNNIMTKYPNAKVLVGTIMQHQYTNVIGFPVKNSNSVLLKDFNNAIKDIANVFGCEVIDFEKCGLDYYNLATYAGDGQLHPNPSGMDLMFKEALKSFS